MKVNIVTANGQEHCFFDASAVFYSNIHDELRVDVNGDQVFACRMGEIEELEIYPE